MLSLLAGCLLTRVNHLYVLPKDLAQADRLLAESLQGLTARQSPQIWIDNEGIDKIVLKNLKVDGYQTEDTSDVWSLVKTFKGQLQGAVLYKLGTHSVNVATSLSGPLRAVAIDESQEEQAKAAGLRILVDTRTMTEQQAWDKYHQMFGKGIVVEQSIDKPGHLRDFAIKHWAFVMDTDDREFRKRVIRESGTHPLVFGWGKSEYDWITDISEAGGTGVAADWCVNLSALESLPVQLPKAIPPASAKNEDGVRYVAFVLSDGDNVQWVTGDFATNPKFYGSPLRGQFPMSWEMSPLLAQFAPRVLKAIYDQAKPTDDFVTGPGLPGYTFPNLHKDREGLAKITAPLLQASNMSIVSFLNQNEGQMTDTFPWLDLKDTTAAIYKDYSPYNRRQGETIWHNGKPCVSYRFLLWEGLTGIDDLVKQIGAMPTEPKRKNASYALINVHAWSFGNSGGPIAAVKQVIDKLPPNTRVVTATQLLDLLVKNHPGD